MTQFIFQRMPRVLTSDLLWTIQYRDCFKIELQLMGKFLATEGINEINNKATSRPLISVQHK